MQYHSVMQRVIARLGVALRSSQARAWLLCALIVLPFSVLAAPPIITMIPPSIRHGTVGTDYGTIPITASGGTAPYTYTTVPANLPPGISLTSGTLSGTPTKGGDFTFTVTATDVNGAFGTKIYTVHIDPILPGAPAIGTAIAGDSQASVNFSPPTDTGGAPIIGYAVFNSSGGQVGTGTSSPIVVLNLINGTSYTFTVVATNMAGPGAASAPVSVTPVAAQTIAFSQGQVNFGSPVQLNAAASSGLAVTYTSTTPNVCTVTGPGILTTVTPGTCIIDANQRGTTAWQAAPQVEQQFAIVVPGGVVTLSTTQLAVATGGTSYSATFTATGGAAPYTYSESGALPTGLRFDPAGTITGIPTSVGSYPITVTVTDQAMQTSQASFNVAVNAPGIVLTPTTLPAGKAGTVYTTTTLTASGGTAAYTYTLTSGTMPVGMTLSPAGLISGTPTSVGSSNITVTATDRNNFQGSQAYTLVVGETTGPVPVATAQAATVLAGKSVTIHAATGATNGPFTTATLTGMPATGTATVQGTDIVYTAAADASGTIGIDFTLSNAFGVSQPAHVTVTVDARPVAQSLTASVIAGTTVQVDLTTTARGGPFTGAKLVSISPANAGSATVQASAKGGYTLAFTAAPTFGGMAQVSYTLNNAFATSDSANISINVAARSDPSKDAEVLGVLDAQADSARRMATGQIGNFQSRLESLHGGGAASGFSNGISMSSASSLRNPDTLAGIQSTMDDQNRNYLVAPEGQPAASRIASSANGTGAAPGAIAFWSGGAVNFGKMQPGTSNNGIDFTTSGVSFGADKQVTSKLTVGLGAGYGHDASDVGQHTSRSTTDSYNVAAYGSYQPTEATYIDAIVGYQWLRFDARRYVTDNGNTVHGNRDGKQVFGSFSVGYQHQTNGMTINPYGRLDIARATLDAYTESGDPIYALAYQGQTVKTSTATVGMLAQWSAKRNYGTWTPQLRAEFGHDMQGSSEATMRYADLLNGPLYQTTLTGQSRNHTMLGAGIALQTLRGWLLRAEYQNYLDNSSRGNQSILLGVEKKFDP